MTKSELIKAIEQYLKSCEEGAQKARRENNPEMLKFYKREIRRVKIQLKRCKEGLIL